MLFDEILELVAGITPLVSIDLIAKLKKCTMIKEALNNLAEFWQRQVFKFEALILSSVILWFKSITKKLETWLSRAS